MRTEAPRWAPPLLAVQFLTRVPVPWLARLTADQARDGLARATGWLPLVGAMIGAVTAAVFAGGALLWPRPLAALVALAVEAWLTGAFHEDAVADFCDAFGGGGRSAEEIRRIMKDSRIGSYGALGLGIAVALRWAAMAALPPALAPVGIVAAAGIARTWAVLTLWLAPPAPTGPGLAKDIGGVAPATVAAALLLTLPVAAALAWVAPWRLLAVAGAGAVFLPWFAAMLRRRIGGSTGDCLGLAAYAGQLAVLLAMVAAR